MDKSIFPNLFTAANLSFGVVGITSRPKVNLR